ncbi:MAG: GNAT family N-acetyltransferase [Deltaproteobacteria bacterium]|nr:GNAT family N-acetyltransferase [Deltaproteobacteria bacterium]
MPVADTEEALRDHLQLNPEVVSVGEVAVEDNIIQSIFLETRTIGGVTVRRLETDDAPGLFELYSQGLSEKPRRLFTPYPLFHTPPASAGELASRIANWGKESDWTALVMLKDELVIGFALLKRFHTEQVTSGIAVRDDFLKRRLGYLLQSIIVEQARLLAVRKFHVKVVSDNMASMRLHEKCGFRQTRILSPDLYKEMFAYLSGRDQREGKEAVERQLVEMTIDLHETTGGDSA